MKKIIAITSVAFLLMFSSTSFAGWTKVSESGNGRVFYVDFDRIREHSGYVYYWFLTDLLKPTKWGDLSINTYFQVDCVKFSAKVLSSVFHKQSMGKGAG